MHSNISNYVNLIESFQSGRIDAKQFEKIFLSLFKSDDASVEYSEQIFNTLDSLFAAVDEYCEDPTLRQQLPKALDERELLRAARAARERLRALVN